MIYRFFIGILLICVAVYYAFCFLEIFGVVKFTKDGEGNGVSFPKMLIPFYYLFKDK